jgi:tRNA A37 threonylcarbamoyladenosine synthetase subunit TsaC/SUA5/YrdC
LTVKIQDFKDLWDDIDMIIDGGPILENNGSRLGSTIIDLSVPGQFKLLRAGWSASTASISSIL